MYGRISFISEVERVYEFVGFLLGFFFRDAVAFLDFANELIALAANHFEIAIGKLAPLHFYLPGGLLPLACYLIPVHLSPHRI